MNRIGGWKNSLEGTTKRVEDNFSMLTYDELNWKPAPERWSIAQHLDHLILVNSSYFPVIERINDGSYVRPFIGSIGFLVRRLVN